MMMKERLATAIPLLDGHRIDTEFSAVSMANSYIGKLQACLAHGRSKTSLIITSGEEREYVAWHIYRLECMHLNSVNFIIVSVPWLEYFDAKPPQRSERLHEIIAIGAAPCVWPGEERRHIKICLHRNRISLLGKSATTQSKKTTTAVTAYIKASGRFAPSR